MEKQKFFTPARVIFSLLSVAIMGMIFYLSCENADKSSETSGFFTDLVLRHLIKGYSGFTPERQDEIHGLVSHIVRKCAHFSAYASLGFCTSCAVGRRRLLSLGSLIAWGISVLYACSDELHQYFVEGRSCELRDVMIDSCGALTGLLVSMAVFAVISRRKNRTSSRLPL
ncbi:MAG: VanZ family protein [Ruminococcus sp.]|nr:VanZ family protein [Ruminococcus sp.]